MNNRYLFDMLKISFALALVLPFAAACFLRLRPLRLGFYLVKVVVAFGDVPFGQVYGTKRL